jgi:hypothetical protein
MRAAVQCHGEPVATPAGVVHAGCSVDTLLVDLLGEVRTWLDQPANQGEVVLLYLENALDDDEAAHAAAVAAIDATLGALVARPAEGGGCQSLPVERSKQELLDAGTPVLITGNCGPGGWNDRVFDRYPSWDERGGSTFDCPAERSEIDFESILVRRYEDSTWLSAMAGSGSHLDAPTIAEMVRCGVNLVGFDQLHPGDDRLPGLVWSWRAEEPSATAVDQCAALGTDGRFFGDACEGPRPVACRTDDGGWAVTADAVAWSAGEDACRAAGHAGAGVPYNGWDSDLLRAAADQLGAGEVWLAYGQDATGDWVTGIPVSEPASEPVDAPGRSEDRPGDPSGHGGPPEAAGVGRGKPIAAHDPVPSLPLVVLAGVALVLAVSISRTLAGVERGQRFKPKARFSAADVDVQCPTDKHEPCKGVTQP